MGFFSGLEAFNQCSSGVQRVFSVRQIAALRGVSAFRHLESRARVQGFTGFRASRLPEALLTIQSRRLNHGHAKHLQTCLHLLVCLPACLCMYVYVCLCMRVCMCVCMYASMYVCMDTCMYVCMYLCICVSMYGCVHVCMYACMYVCMYVRMHVRVYVRTHVCMYDLCMYACMHVRMCVCVCFMHV